MNKSIGAERLDELRIHKMRAMHTDESRGFQQFVKAAQGFGGHEFLSTGKNEFGVVAVRFASDDIFNINKNIAGSSGYRQFFTDRKLPAF